MARSSQLHIALDQKYIDEKEFTALCGSTVTFSKKISAFIHYLEGYAGNSRVKKSAGRAIDNLQLSTRNLQPA
jgi:hypothetical protein